MGMGMGLGGGRFPLATGAPGPPLYLHSAACIDLQTHANKFNSRSIHAVRLQRCAPPCGTPPGGPYMQYTSKYVWRSRLKHDFVQIKQDLHNLRPGPREASGTAESVGGRCLNRVDNGQYGACQGESRKHHHNRAILGAQTRFCSNQAGPS